MRKIWIMLLLLSMCWSVALADELVLGSRGDEVAEVQKRLIELGYLSGTADGQYGTKTARAVELFQKVNGLSMTGTVNQATYKRMFSDEAQTDAIVSAQNRLIELGYFSGSADGIWGEQSAQNRLVELGYYSGAADGTENDGTAAALKAFQELHGLSPSGELDEKNALLLQEAAGYEVLQTGSEGDEVAALQDKLIQLGFLEGTADGIYGKQTRQAVLDFQKHLTAQGKEDIEADGIAAPLTQEYIFSNYYSSYLSELKLGDQNAEVMRIERRLRNLGYLDAEPDETMDDYSIEALKIFQQTGSLSDTGYADRETTELLFSGGAPEAESYVPHEIAPGDSGEAVREVQQAMLRYGMYTGRTDGMYGEGLETALTRFYEYLSAAGSEYASAFSERNAVSEYAQELLVLKDFSYYTEVGQDGADAESVKRIQRRLYSLYYLSSFQIDGEYGAATQAAIAAFQKNNGLDETGVSDETTQKVLFSEAAVGNWTPYKLEIRISEQRVYVYQLSEENEYEKIKTFIC